MKNDTPTQAIREMLDWMRAQMYGNVRTIWSGGNEYDRMYAAADLLAALIREEEGADYAD